MDTAETHRKICLERQTGLRSAMMDPAQFDQAMRRLLEQHALLHSRKVEPAAPWSFEDEILDDLPEEQVRRIPTGGDHSIAWLVWHMARCEDITMNLLVAGTPQVLMQAGWLQSTRSPIRDTGNAMELAALADFSGAIDVEALRGYRAAVGRRTREIVALLQPADLKRKVEASRLKRVFDEGAVVEAARGIADYWGNRDVAGLLLMPATRHNLIHLGEALKLKRKLRTI